MRHYQRSLLIAAVLASAACSSDDSSNKGPAEAGPAADSASGQGTCSWRTTSADGGAAGGPVDVTTPFATPNDKITFTPPAIPCKIFNITDYGAISTPLPADAGAGEAGGSEAGSGEAGTGSDAAVGEAGSGADAGTGDAAGIGSDATGAGSDAATSALEAGAEAAVVDAANDDGGSLGDALAAIDATLGSDAGGGSEGGVSAEAGSEAATGTSLGDAGPTATGPIPTNTKAFKDAIAAAVAAGGGVVDVPAGTWQTGPIHLDSNIELHLEAGATVLFSQNFNDYLPAVLTRWEGLDVMNWSPFVYALNATNVAITGPGTLDGRGSAWWSWKTPSKVEDQRIYTWWLAHLTGLSGPPTAMQVPTSAVVNGLRPTMIECNHCTNFLVDGITTANPAYWVTHPLYSTNVIIRNSHITSNPSGTNGDGIDVDSCKKVLIENDVFATSDDIISIKSGLNEVGIDVATPTEELVVRNITASLGHALSFGSEMSGGITNVSVDTATLDNQQYLMRIKTMPGRGGVISNVWFQNVQGSNWTSAALEITTNYPSSTIPPNDPTKLPEVKNVIIKNVSGTAASTVPVYNFVGLPTPPFSGIALDTVTLTGGNGTCKTASGITVTNSMLTGLPASTTSITCP